jgi:SGNH domain (fused to AT3 domains)
VGKLLQAGRRDRWLITDIAHERDKLTPEEASSVFKRSLAKTTQGLQQSGKQVIVIEDAPTFDLDPLYRIRAAVIPARHALAKWMGVQSASDPGYAPIGNLASVKIADAHMKTTVAAFHGVQLIDRKPQLCSSEDECSYWRGEMVLYSDPQHLSADGAQYVLRDFHFPALSASGE